MLLDKKKKQEERDFIMKNKLVSTILLICMAFSLAACGNGADKDNKKDNIKDNIKDNTENKKQEETKEDEVVYTIKVVDEENNPIGGMMVQLCKETYIPEFTNAQGIATFKVPELSNNYRATITSLPEGYSYEGERIVFFEDGSTEVVFVIKSKK